MISSQSVKILNVEISNKSKFIILTVTKDTDFVRFLTCICGNKFVLFWMPDSSCNFVLRFSLLICNFYLYFFDLCFRAVHVMLK